MADDRFACCRVVSIRATKPDKVKSCSIAISRNAVQNGSSRLTLVLWPEITTERLTIEDFITFPLAEACLGPPLNGQIGFRFQEELRTSTKFPFLFDTRHKLQLLRANPCKGWRLVADLAGSRHVGAPRRIPNLYVADTLSHA